MSIDCFFFLLNFLLGETPLHIAIVYNDLSSVQMLIKHGFDVNKRVLGDFSAPELRRRKSETKMGRENQSARFFQQNGKSKKQFNLLNSNPDSENISMTGHCSSF